MPSQPTVSVVIPTNRQLARIRPSVEAALRDRAAIEVLVVVDGPQAGTLGPELDALDAATPRLRVLRLPRRVGAEVARRIGAEAALGDVVWFLDDDVIPGNETGLGHAARHATADVDIVVGSLATPFESVPGVSRVFAWLYDESCRHEFARQVADPSLILKGLWAGNYSMRRPAVRALAAVPDAFSHTRHGDRAFGLVCARAGLTAVCDPALTATHNYGPSLAEWRKDCRKQGAGRVEIHHLFEDLIGPAAANPWLVGLGQRGRTALRLAQVGRPFAAFVAAAAATCARVAAERNHLRMALEFGRILRSVEQLRGADPALGPHRRSSPQASPLPAPRPADVSLLVVSRGPAVRLRRVLEVWRPHVAEIVVVADLSGESNLLDAVADLADRTSTVERAFPIESVLERCWPLCSRSFVFRGDDDEIPSTVLLSELQSLTLDATLSQAGIPMRWLWPGPDTWIESYPWAANPQPKLFRNLPGLMKFPGRIHTAEHLSRPSREVRLPIYHLRTLDAEADRRTRAARYAAAGSGPRHFDGRRANSQYLPEDAGDLTLADVPSWDLDAVTFVAGPEGGRGPARPAGAGSAYVPAAAGDAAAASGPVRFSATRHRVSVRVTAIHRPAAPGGCVVLEVVVANRSDAVVSGADGAGACVALSTRWQRSDRAGSARIVDGVRFDIGEPIPPGRAVSRTLALEMLLDPGQWQVTVDLVEEGVGWGGDGDQFEIEILPHVAPQRPAHRDVDLFKAILIETRNICNRHCWFCKFGQERQDPDIEEIEWATIRQILANLKDLDYNGRISWHGINEPLMDPRIFDIVVETRAACPESFISLVTNGDLLTQHAYDRLKTSVDVVGVSVYDDKVFDKVSPLADGQMKVIDMRRAAAGRLENRGGTVLHEAESFREHQRLFADRTCARPSFMLPVKPSGKVALCCADMYADVVMGNVHEQRLEDIWYGEAFTTYRRVLAREGRRNLKLCQGCSYNGDAGRIFYPLPETVTHPKVQVGAITVPRGTA